MVAPVLVVGAGPVGLTLAGELARYRVPVRIIDKAPARSDKSKALAVWARTLELLDRGGGAASFMESGLRGVAATIRNGRDEIGRIALDQVASPCPALVLIPQPESERLLQEQFERCGSRVERGSELTGFDQHDRGVSCMLRHADGETEILEASWLVGCDGAHSLVRPTLGLEFEGDTLPANFILADLRIDGLPIPPDELGIFWHADGILMLFPLSSGRYRVIADVAQQPRHDPTMDEIDAIVAKRGPGGLTLSDPGWLAGFGVNERKVREFRKGRVFLAGDAAHIHSPAGGQGMNTGMQDAFNLAWKLALVMLGQAAPSLLDSYSPERSAVAAEILAGSGRLTRLAMLRNPVVLSLRNFAAHHLLGWPGVGQAVADRMAEIGIAYPDSPLNGSATTGLDGPRPGERIVADRPFGAGSSPRFALVAKPDPRGEAVLRRFDGLLEPALRKPVGEQDGIWLVRPDGYVTATARTGNWAPIEACLAAIAPSRSRS